MRSLANYALDLAIFLESSTKYQSFKHGVYRILEDPTCKYKKYFDFFMIFMIFSSVLILVGEVKIDLKSYLLYFNIYIISSVFLMEYILRLWVYNSNSQIIIDLYERDTFLNKKLTIFSIIYKIGTKKFEFIKKPSSIVDLLAITPFFHEVRLLRVFVLFRVFKLFRYTQSMSLFYSVLKTKKFELVTLFFFVTLVMSVSAVLIYVMEANNPDSPINTMYEAFYWSLVTISTVGYGDLYPVSDYGRGVAMVIIISGIAVLSFSTSIVVSAFNEKFDEIKDQKVLDDIKKVKNFYLVCGYNELSRNLLTRLKNNGRNIIVLDSNHDAVNLALKDGFRALNFDPTKSKSYMELDIDLEKNVIKVLSMYDSDVQNIYVTLTLKSICENIKVVAILQKKSNYKKYQLAGVDDIIFTQELIGLTAKELSGKPIAFEAINALRSIDNEIILDEIKIDERIVPHIDELLSIVKNGYKVILIGSYKIENESFSFYLDDDFSIKLGDVLLCIGKKDILNELKIYLRR